MILISWTTGLAQKRGECGICNKLMEFLKINKIKNKEMN